MWRIDAIQNGERRLVACDGWPVIELVVSGIVYRPDTGYGWYLMRCVDRYWRNYLVTTC